MIDQESYLVVTWPSAAGLQFAELDVVRCWNFRRYPRDGWSNAEALGVDLPQGGPLFPDWTLVRNVLEFSVKRQVHGGASVSRCSLLRAVARRNAVQVQRFHCG